jgi:hypothetical protein
MAAGKGLVVDENTPVWLARSGGCICMGGPLCFDLLWPWWPPAASAQVNTRCLCHIDDLSWRDQLIPRRWHRPARTSATRARVKRGFCPDQLVSPMTPVPRPPPPPPPRPLSRHHSRFCSRCEAMDVCSERAGGGCLQVSVCSAHVVVLHAEAVMSAYAPAVADKQAGTKQF